MFEQEKSSLLDVVAYIEDEELREELTDAINDTVRSIVYSRKRKAQEAADNEAGLCRFDEAWRGRCNQPSVNNDRDRCSEHLITRCRVCDRLAVLTCPETMGLVCGTPVCKRHTRCDRGRHY